MHSLRRWRFIALLLLAFSLPFELDRPLLTVGPLAITNVEVLLALTIALTALTVVRRPWQLLWPPRYWLWLIFFAGGLLVSTVFAPMHQLNALKASLRLLTGILLALTTLPIVQSRRQSYAVAGALLGGGIAAAAIGFAETLTGTEFAWLSWWRGKVTVAGPFIRLTGPFDYANQTAMFIEATLPLLLAFIWWVVYRSWPRSWRMTVAVGLGLVFLGYLQASFLTFSRASFATLFLVSGGMGVWCYYRQPPGRQQQGRWWLGFAAATLIGVGLNSIINSGFRLRLQTATQEEWYRASFVVPDHLEMKANETTSVTLTLANEGSLVWRSDGLPPIILAARWVNPVNQQQFGQLRWPLPHPLNPGQLVTLTVPVKAPANAGPYELHWDLVQENVTWFSYQSGLVVVTKVEVSSGTAEAPAVVVGSPAWEYPAPIPDRQTLWRLAGQLWWERPLTGIGLDNFRLIYGERLSLKNWNTTIHTNNWYIEILVTTGLVGAMPFFIWLACLVIDIGQQTRRPGITMWQVALAAAILTFLVHGLLDFFLLFSATGLLFWLLIGLWVREKQQYASWL
ncbi:MAG: O-antigen ligase family protein [Chloroflexi bacterium]|nr:O-antigen ligase family protein [Chloroflexota bacterium]MBP8058422.1 O-antigen ligase family protein [Chloroflexota bacterium]